MSERISRSLIPSWEILKLNNLSLVLTVCLLVVSDCYDYPNSLLYVWKGDWKQVGNISWLLASRVYRRVCIHSTLIVKLRSGLISLF